MWSVNTHNLTYDWDGNVTSGSGIMNISAPLWQRETFPFTLEETYEMNTDGTATPTYMFTTPDDLTLEVN